MIPGVRETPATIEAAFPWIAPGARAGVAGRAPGARRRPAPGGRRLRRVHRRPGRAAARWSTLFNRCQYDVVLPTRRAGDPGRRLTTGIENYKEFLQAWSGLSGAGQNFDGNGNYTRFQPGGGAYPVRTGTVGRRRRPLLRQRHRAAARHAPGTRRRKPPYKPQRRRATSNALPDLNAATDRPAARDARRSRSSCASSSRSSCLVVGGARRSPATSCPTSASTCPPGCR